MRRRDLTTGLLAAGVAAPLISPTMAVANRSDGPDRLEPVDHIILDRNKIRVMKLALGQSGETGRVFDLSKKFPQSKDFRRVIFGQPKLPFGQWVKQSDAIGPVRFDDEILYADFGVNLQTIPILIGDGKIVFKIGELKKLKRREASVPWLGDIPIVGWLFKTREKQENKRNLLIFVTPKIVRDQTS